MLEVSMANRDVCGDFGRSLLKNHSKTFRILEQLLFETQVSIETECLSVCQEVTMWPKHIRFSNFGLMENLPVDWSNILGNEKCFQQMMLRQLDNHEQKKLI